MNMAKGVTGFFVCGSTAGVSPLKPEERERLLEIVRDEAQRFQTEADDVIRALAPIELFGNFS
jgi:dihydrodipicolinate synthase/N-acetylneuraminate lyase